ncbi:MAG TPA: class I SAM-dependent methyltransferase [Rhodopila sp.]|nr:class I SAM-dependent methyltransferase [Rhodopila sp.]
MNDAATRPPPALARILQRTAHLGFDAACDVRTGALLRALAAMRPGGWLVELGTGTGAGTAWLLDGMDQHARLITIDNDPAAQAIARDELGGDQRLEIICADARAWLAGAVPNTADLVFADTWAGKYEMLEASLALLRPGGVWIGDDLLPQPNWPEGHAARVPKLLEALNALSGHAVVPLAWASGIVLVTRRA